jgi:hypothetical protein
LMFGPGPAAGWPVITVRGKAGAIQACVQMKDKKRAAQRAAPIIIA